jgi:hypothetical protein
VILVQLSCALGKRRGKQNRRLLRSEGSTCGLSDVHDASCKLVARSVDRAAQRDVLVDMHAKGTRETARLDFVLLLPPCFPDLGKRGGEAKTAQWSSLEKSGAGEGIRTLDPNLGKVVLYP